MFLLCDYEAYTHGIAVEILSVCPSVKHVYCDKTKAPSEKSSIMTNRKSPMSFPMSRRWTAYVAPKTPNSVTVHFIRQMARVLRIYWSNAHTTITCLLSDYLSHYGDVRCALAVSGSGPTCCPLWSILYSYTVMPLTKHFVSLQGSNRLIDSVTIWNAWYFANDMQYLSFLRYWNCFTWINTMQINKEVDASYR